MAGNLTYRFSIKKYTAPHYLKETLDIRFFIIEKNWQLATQVSMSFYSVKEITILSFRYTTYTTTDQVLPTRPPFSKLHCWAKFVFKSGMAFKMWLQVGLPFF